MRWLQFVGNLERNKMAVVDYNDSSFLDHGKFASVGDLITELIERLNVTVVVFNDSERLGACKLRGTNQP